MTNADLELKKRIDAEILKIESSPAWDVVFPPEHRENPTNYIESQTALMAPDVESMASDEMSPPVKGKRRKSPAPAPDPSDDDDDYVSPGPCQPRLNRRKFTDNEIAEALERSFGLITLAATLLSKSGKTDENGNTLTISHVALTERINKNKRLTAVMIACADRVLDMAEMELYKQSHAGNLTATIFLLKCKGKHRGYVEKQIVESTGANGGPIQQQIAFETRNLSKLTDFELQTLRDICRRLRGDTDEQGQTREETRKLLEKEQAEK
jgi:hypothetical protein